MTHPGLPTRDTPDAKRPRRAALVVAIAALSALGCQQPRGEPAPDERWCTYRYAIDDDVPVCATFPLGSEDIARLQAQLDDVSALYPRFASACGVPFDAASLTPPVLHVLRYDELNDRAAFPRDESVGNILGRYYVGRSSVFVTERALGDGGDIHLPHELAHWIHDESGVTDADDDERLARAFHRFYRARTSTARAPRVASALGEDVVSRRFAGDASALTLDGEGPPALDRSLAERADGPRPSPLIGDLCGR